MAPSPAATDHPFVDLTQGPPFSLQMATKGRKTLAGCITKNGGSRLPLTVGSDERIQVQPAEVLQGDRGGQRSSNRGERKKDVSVGCRIRSSNQSGIRCCIHVFWNIHLSRRKDTLGRSFRLPGGLKVACCAEGEDEGESWVVGSIYRRVWVNHE